MSHISKQLPRAKPVDPQAIREKKTETKAAKSRILSADEFMQTFVPPVYVIEGIIQRGRTYSCTSMTGHGKTAVWLFFSCMIIAGRMIGTIKVVQGNVVYLAGENPDDVCARLFACAEAYGLPRHKLPYILPRNFPLTEDAAEELRKEIDDLNLDPVAIIGDTLAAFYHGDNDNDNVPMGEFGRHQRILTRCKGNPAVIFQAHPIKNADKDNLVPRGGGAYMNEMDGNLTLWSDALGEETTLHWQKKLRAADFPPVHFILRSEKVGEFQDQWSKPIWSIVAEAVSMESAANAKAQAVTDENAVLYWTDKQPGISLRDIATNAGWLTKQGGPNHSKVNRLLTRLKKSKLVTQARDGKFHITEAGKKEI
jgi:hypothetical protein